MTHSIKIRIEPTRPSPPPKPVVPALPALHVVKPDVAPKPATKTEEQDPIVTNLVPVATGGHLAPAYTQFVVNPDTHDVVLRVRDSLTDRILREFPSEELQAMSRNLSQYADILAGRRASAANGPKA